MTKWQSWVFGVVAAGEAVLEVQCIAIFLSAPVRANHGVIEALEPIIAQPEIEVTKRGLAFRNKVVIEQRDYSRNCLDIGGQFGAEDGRDRWS